MLCIPFFLFISLICSAINILDLIYSVNGTEVSYLGIISMIIFTLSILIFSFYNGMKKRINYVIIAAIYWITLTIATLISNLIDPIIFNIFSVTTLIPVTAILPSNSLLLDILIFIITLSLTIACGYLLGILLVTSENKNKLGNENNIDTNTESENKNENATENETITGSDLNTPCENISENADGITLSTVENSDITLTNESVINPNLSYSDTTSNIINKDENTITSIIIDETDNVEKNTEITTTSELTDSISENNSTNTTNDITIDSEITATTIPLNESK